MSMMNYSDAAQKEEPDFAFPEKVEKDADVSLKAALDRGDDVAALQSAIQLIAARNLISSESFPSNVALLDSISGKMKAPYSQLTTLLEAGLYTSLYSVSPWQYNNRTLPLDSYPDDPFAWSGDLFAKKVLSLIDDATSDLTIAEQTPIKDILPLLENFDYAEKAGLSVADFLVIRSVALLGNFTTGYLKRVIPFFGSTEPVASDIREECGIKERQLTDALCEWRMKGDNVAALVAAIDLKVNNMPYEEKSAFLDGWVKKLADKEESGLLLHQCLQFIPGASDMAALRKRELYDMGREYIRKFPSSPYLSVIKYDLANLTSKQASLELPSVAVSGKSVKGKVQADNMNTVYVLLYRVPESSVEINSLKQKDFPSKATFVRSIKVDLPGSGPFSAESEFELPPLTPGYYVAIPQASAKLSSKWKNEVERWSIKVLNVSDIALVTSLNTKESGSGRLYVVDAVSQRPLEGAKVSFYPQDRFSNPSKILTTDSEGGVAIVDGMRRVRVAYGNSVLWQGTDYYFNNYGEKETKGGRILTDLSIYKPGDKVQFSVVAWNSKDHENTLLRDTRLKIQLRDANWQTVDTMTLVTDKFGRLSGSFNLPEQGLLGYYSIGISDASDSNGRFAEQGFEVAEYKTPTFFVSLLPDSEKVYAPGDTVKFLGEVKTYSGMPLGDSEVKYTVDWHQWWKWFTGGIDNASYSGSVVAFPDGKFEISLPTANLKGTIFERGIFSVSATVTSPSGETQISAPLSFSLGDDFSIRPEIAGDKIKVTGDTLRFNVPVYDILNHPVIKDVDYSVVEVEGNKEILSGSFKSPVLELSSSSLPSGYYKFCFKLPQDTVTSDYKIILWRESDALPPYATELWLPVNEIVAPAGSASVNVRVGSGFKGSWVLCQISDEDRIVERKWVAVNGENVEVGVAAPQSQSRRWVSFIGMHDHKVKTATVTIVPEEATRKMSVKTLSFRDKISAGDKEKWVFSFKVADTVQPGLPAMAVMSNKALDILSPFNWNFSLGGTSWYNYSRLSGQGVYNRWVRGNFSVMPKYKTPDSTLPDWNTYNQILAGVPYRGLFIRGMKMRKSAATKGTYALDDAEMVVSENQVVNEVFMAAPAPMADTAMTTDKKMEESEEAATDSAAGGFNDAGNSGASKKEEELRPVDMPLAFFMPTLTGDEEGNVNVEFITPNFNTTWKFQIMGYNEDLLSAGTVLEAVASKPVMVQANPPRYLRTGDRASVSALLFNNSPESVMLHGEIVIFNPLTGETVTSYHLGADSATPGSNRTITVDFPVPSDVTALGMKAFAYAGDYSDGEQVLIPVLPSSTPVVESTQFYLGNGESHFSQKLPKYQKDASLTLKYCNNPIWECVLALPSIAKVESDNVLSISRALYANGMAKDIMGKFPTVKSGLQEAFAHRGEKPKDLVSNLDKDSMLKTVALINTPWVNNAASETQRMQSLDQLLDDGRLAESVSSLYEKLSSLQNSDGGWSWCKGMGSSEFITTNVLANLAALQKYGADYASGNMVKRAIAYCDKELYDNYIKSDRHFSTVTMLRYLYVRGILDNGNGKSGFSALKKEALKAIDADWREFSVYDKATAALLLNRTPGYEKTSRLILESLRQLASKSEAKGWWYDNLYGGWTGMPKLVTTARALEAFAEIEPSSEAVDGLRQWLVIQKETEDWGDNSNTTGVINAILSCGTDWTAHSELPAIRIDGKELNIGDSELLTGLITLSLTPKDASGKTLEIEKRGEGPSWGGVISQYIAPMNDVKSERCENLMIEKQLLLVTEKAGAESLENISLSGKQSLKVGDKVRVTLTLTCEKDMDYVAVIDERSACLEPIDQISGYSINDHLSLYREVRDTKTSFFIGYLPKGVSVISYDCYVDREGTYALGIASAQSQYSPLQSAHSAGGMVKVEVKK